MPVILQGAISLIVKSDKVKSGSNKYADAAIFSFHAVKHIAAGEGGVLTCKSEKTAAQALNVTFPWDHQK